MRSTLGLRMSLWNPSLHDLKFSAAALTFCLLWSSAFIAAKFGLRSAPPLTLLALRFSLAGPIMLALAAGRGDAWPRSARTIGFLVVLGLLYNGIYLALIFTAMRTITAGLSAVLASLNPLFTALLAHYLLRERLSWAKGLGLALGLGGVAFIMRHRIGTQTDDMTGVYLALAGMGCFALGTVLFKRYPPRESVLMMNGIGLTASGVVLLPVGWIAGRNSPVVFDASLFMSVAYLVLALSIGATLLWFYLLRHGTASKASTYHFLNPAFGLILAWLLLGEPLVWSDLLGLIPIALGIRLVTRATELSR